MGWIRLSQLCYYAQNLWRFYLSWQNKLLQMWINKGFWDKKMILIHPSGLNLIPGVLMQRRQESQCRKVMRTEVEVGAMWCEDGRRSYEPQNTGGFWKMEKIKTQTLQGSLQRQCTPANTLALDFGPLEL